MQNSLSTDKIELFETMKASRAVAKLSVPTVFACLVMVLYNLADTLFVGMLNDPIQTSAVTLVAPVILLFNAVNNLFGTGTASLISRCLGKQDYDGARKTACFGFYASLACGVLFSLLALLLQNPLLKLLGSSQADHDATLGYLQWTVFCGAAPAILNVVIGNMVRAEGSALHATLGTVSGCILNMILDPIFILPGGLNMGAAGAGLATFLSNLVACLYFFIYMAVKRRNSFVTANPAFLRPNAAIVKGIASVGLPASLQNILNVTGMTLLNNLMAGYGTEAVSAIGISHKLAMIPMYISMGIGQGIMPLVGYNYSAGRRGRIREVLFFTIKISGVIVLVLTVAFVGFARPIMAAFMENEAVVSYGTAFLRAQSLAIPFFAMDFLAIGVAAACGIGKYALFCAIARKIVLEIPAMLLLDHIAPMYGIPYAPLVAEAVLSVAAVFLLRRIIREPKSL